MTYSTSFRRKILNTKSERGLSIRKTAKEFNLSPVTVVKWMRNIEPKETRIRKSRVDIKQLEEDIKQYPDSYIYERAVRFGMSKSGMQYTLKRLNITYKKNLQSCEEERRRTYFLPE